MITRRLAALAPLFPVLLSAARALAQASAPMRTKTLGNSDLKVSVLGIGGNSFGAPPGGLVAARGALAGRRILDLAEGRKVIDAAFESGVTFYDTADVYENGGSESHLGEVLKDRRKQVVFATKWGGRAVSSQAISEPSTRTTALFSTWVASVAAANWMIRYQA